jgi:Peptidase family S41
MLLRRKFLQLCLSGAGMAWAGPGFSQTGAAVNDGQLVGDILKALHPGLFRYLSPKQFDKNYAAFQKSFSASTDLAEQYLALSKLLAGIRCGHSYANFYNQSDAIKAKLFDRSSRLPFAFRWIGQQMVVTQDQSGTGKVQPGTIIQSIDGIPASSILSRLLPYVRADGHNDAKRRMLLSVTGRDQFETFDIFHGLIFGPPKSGNFDLSIINPGGKTALVQMAQLSLAQRRSFLKPEPVKDAPLWDWRTTGDGVAVLKMDNWGLYDSSWKWEDWLNDRLNSLSGARGLIVDLRENEGGLDCGDMILARFAKSDFKKPLEKRLVRYQKTPDALNPYLDTWDDSFRNLGDTVTRLDDRFFEQKYDSSRDVIAAKGPQLQMPLVILTSAENSSATFQFANLAKLSGFGTLIGEATGGNRRGINGARFFFVRLPQSGLEFDLPLMATYPETPQPDAGLMPDIEVLTTADDIARGRDRAMQVALNHVLKKRS